MTPKSKKMLIAVVVLAAAATVLIVAARSRHGSHEMRHPMRAMVLEVRPEAKRVTLRNQAVPGVMSEQVAEYSITDLGALADLKPGDEIYATMVIDKNDHWYAEDIRIVKKH